MHTIIRTATEHRWLTVWALTGLTILLLKAVADALVKKAGELLADKLIIAPATALLRWARNRRGTEYPITRDGETLYAEDVLRGNFERRLRTVDSAAAVRNRVPARLLPLTGPYLRLLAAVRDLLCAYGSGLSAAEDLRYHGYAGDPPRPRLHRALYLHAAEDYLRASIYGRRARRNMLEMLSA